DAAGEVEAATEPEPAGPARPSVLTWDPTAESVEIPQQDSYALRVVAGRKLYDAGLMVQKSPFTAPLAPPAVLHVSPQNYEALGVTADEKVKVTSARGSVVLPVTADPGVPKGVAWLAFNQPGHNAADLIDAADTVTDVRVETLQ
ncbi:MAG TPA: molybdopterin dinucleotide binding domain-containing protein, partial [Acidimicrobiia bacterium]|nr:molybdopterin dinucleotide binding domain-containing protein [Acidimicrobiia bacterium]